MARSEFTQGRRLCARLFFSLATDERRCIAVTRSVSGTVQKCLFLRSETRIVPLGLHWYCHLILIWKNAIPGTNKTQHAHVHGKIMPDSLQDRATEELADQSLYDPMFNKVYETFENTLRAQASDIQQLNNLCVSAASSQAMVCPTF
jgi:hypothetical protein